VQGAIRSIACLLFVSLTSGQQSVSTSGGANRAADVYRSDTTISVDSDLVLIPVTVTDGSGRVVAGLEKEHFTLFENSTQQSITHFASEDAPVSIGIVFDASDSMAPRLHKALESLNALLNNANPADEFFLVRFSTQATLVAPMAKGTDEIRQAVSMLQVGGSTALLDGVRLAMTEMHHAHYVRKAIIIISDGEDNCSHWSVRELKEWVREQDVLIYAIGITGPADALNSGAALLTEIANQTGGRMFQVNKLKQLPDIAATIGGWLRKQYILGYVPADSLKDGSYRKVQLKVDRPKGFPRLHAVWRQGYYAPKE
jgi:VWFA-related protein